MLQVNLQPQEIDELKKFRRTESSRNAEHALIVLKSSKGLSPPQIAKELELHEHTVRDWIKRYLSNGIEGLKRKFAPGKSGELREKVKKSIVEVVDESPLNHGYSVSIWTTALLVNWLEKVKQIKTSQDTVERALKEEGYHYKRNATTTPEKAPTKKEKKTAINKMLKDIKKEMEDSDCEIFALDEAHFSNEPYVLSGWQKKLWSKTDTHACKAGKENNIWLFKFKDKKVLLEKRSVR